MSLLPSKAIIVGFGGVTNGGKTTICNEIEKYFTEEKFNYRVKVIHLDNYYRPQNDPNHIYLAKYGIEDWESLNSLYTDRFLVDIQQYQSQCDLLLIEGFLIYNIFPSNKESIRYDLAYFFDLSYEECAKRRSKRVYTPPDTAGYFEEHVWPSYLQAKTEAFEKNKNIEFHLIDTTKDNFENIKRRIIENIKNMLK